MSLKILRSKKSLRSFVIAKKSKNLRIGFVPTMGFLHDGHLSLFALAKKKCDIVIASIFVNPIQFGMNEDLSRYPRDEKGDIEKLRQAGISAVFIPKIKDIYSEDFSTFVEPNHFSEGLCGTFRPGHFRGVVTVVLKLFNLVTPDVAIFGKKDFQQFLVIKKMATDLNLCVQILGAKTLREKSGLAMSSRNHYLSAKERLAATSLYQGLSAIRSACKKNLLETKNLKKEFLKNFSNDMTLQYLEFRHTQSWETLDRVVKGKTVAAVAAFSGKTRLIDNIIL